MSLAGLRVLVVEDEAMIAMMVEDFLEELGCVVAGSASRLEDALAKGHTMDVDVALLDVNLAGQVSYPVAEVLQARAVPFVFTTGYGQAALPAALQGAHVLPKPFTLIQLAEALRSIGQGTSRRPSGV